MSRWRSSSRPSRCRSRTPCCRARCGGADAILFTHQIISISPQGSKRKPGLCSPYFGSRVIAAGDHELPAPIKLDVGDQVGVRWDRVLDVALSQVPDLHTVVLTWGDYMVAIWAPINTWTRPWKILFLRTLEKQEFTCDSFQMPFKKHDALPSPQVPHSPKWVQTFQKNWINLEGGWASSPPEQASAPSSWKATVYTSLLWPSWCKTCSEFHRNCSKEKLEMALPQSVVPGPKDAKSYPILL